MVDFILSIFFPLKCPYCSKNINRKMNECTVCKSQFPKYPRIEPLPSGEICVSPFVYDSMIRQAVVGYKFYGKKNNAKSFSDAICTSIEKVYKDMSFEVVACVPLSKERYKKRGFNQSEIIARNIAQYFEKPFENLLIKTRDNTEQHNLSAKERADNVRGVYVAADIEKIRDKTILLIDDVATTGNTLSECCHVLKENGAERILCAVIAIAGESILEYTD